MPNATTTIANPLRVHNGEAPKEGRLCVPYQVDFSAQQAWAIDMTLLQQMQQRISFVQSIFIDNSQSAQPFIATMQNTNQSIVCPPYSQGYFPIALSSQVTLTVQSTSGLVIKLLFFNFGVAAAVWGVTQPLGAGGATMPVSDAVLDGTVANGAVQTQVSGNIAPVSGSGTIAAANTSQVLFAANAARRYWRIMNTSNADLWINDNGGAAGVNVGDSFVLSARGSYETTPGLASNKAIAIFGAAAGQQFSAIQA